jgi:enoyl-CoA hydratase/carnithine racemase
MSMSAFRDHTTIDLRAHELSAEIEGDTLTVTIDNPAKRNAVTADGYHGIKRAAMIVADEPDLQFLVITGSADVFCSGGDLSPSPNQERTWDSFTEAYDTTPFEVLSSIPKIVICAINGLALGGGLVMALFADLVISSDRARFRVPDLTRGVFEAYIAARLPSRIGTLRANHLIYGNDWIDASEALQSGLVGKVVPHDLLTEETGRLLARVRQTGPAARAAMKRAMAQQLPCADKSGMWSFMGSAEQGEAYAAFLEKRSPDWNKDLSREGFVSSRRAAWYSDQ